MKHTVRQVQLKNGARGLLVHVPGAQVMSFDLNFRAGDYLCSEDKWELAHVMEHLVLGANQKHRSSNKFNRVLEENGAYSNAATGAYDIDYYAECADFEWDRIFDLMILAISRPLFLETEFTAEMGNVNEELTQRSNNYAAVLAQSVRKALGFMGYTYKAGLESMSKIQLDDVRTFHKLTHFTRNMRFIISGNIRGRSDQIISKLEAISLPEGDSNRLELPEEVGSGKCDQLYLNYKNVPNLYFTLESLHQKVFTEPEIDAANVVNHILNVGYTSKIFGKAREQGIVYDLSSSSYSTKTTSGWGIDGQVSRDNAPKLFALIAKEIKKILTDGVDLRDLQHVKKSAIGGYHMSAQTVFGTANGYANRFFWDDTVIPYDSYPERINSVTRERAQDALQKLFADESWMVGFLGTASKEERENLCSTIATIWH
ncbi:insulinase family protein [Candidatus Saccharibacteria bacterium]|nr:insulinase family protein [Candidatus Saccharibacteria bacterium]MCB9821355.1 insulinase family protein [Candidatus Nomurabacteria bacterium]